MFCHADGTYARTATAVGRGERLVQVQVADIRADESRIGQSHLGVHVGAVHVDLCAAGVDDAADFHDFRLEDAVRGGVGYHQGGEFILVGFRFGAQVVHVHVALGVAGAGDGSESCLDSRSGVGAVGGGGNQNLVAVSLPDALLVGADDAESCVFACRARVGLQADAGESGDGLQFLAEVVYQFSVAFRLFFGHQRVHVHEFGAAEGEHFGGGVELHGTRAE